MNSRKSSHTWEDPTPRCLALSTTNRMFQRGLGGLLGSWGLISVLRRGAQEGFCGAMCSWGAHEGYLGVTFSLFVLLRCFAFVFCLVFFEQGRLCLEAPTSPHSPSADRGCLRNGFCGHFRSAWKSSHIWKTPHIWEASAVLNTSHIEARRSHNRGSR